MLFAGAESATLQALGSIGEFVGGVGVAVGVPVALVQLHSGRRLTKESRVYEYAQRLEDPDLIPILVKAREFWQCGQNNGTEKGLKRWDELDAPTRLEVVLPMNLFEAIGQAYMDNYVHRGLARKYLRAGAEVYFEEARWFIEYQRRLFRERELKGVPWEQWQRMLYHFNADPCVRAMMRLGLAGPTLDLPPVAAPEEGA